MNGRTLAPTGTFTQVSAGGSHSCAVRTDGTVACWGNTNGGRATPPSGTFTQVSAGTSHTCGLATDGTVTCWGVDARGQSSAPEEGTFVDVSAGVTHSCAVDIGRRRRLLGVTTPTGSRRRPRRSSPRVSAGKDHTCGLTATGAIVCWGLDRGGRLQAPAGTFAGVDAGVVHSCALDQRRCRTVLGQFVRHGDGAARQRDEAGVHRVEPAVRHPVEQLGAGCWGDEGVPPTGAFREIAQRQWFGCGIRSNQDAGVLGLRLGWFDLAAGRHVRRPGRR